MESAENRCLRDVSAVRFYERLETETGSADKCLNLFSFMLGYAIKVSTYTWPRVIRVLCVFEGILNKATRIWWCGGLTCPLIKDGVTRPLHGAFVRLARELKVIIDRNRNLKR